jgi:nicotinate phosphoribosyltransferase
LEAAALAEAMSNFTPPPSSSSPALPSVLSEVLACEADAFTTVAAAFAAGHGEARAAFEVAFELDDPHVGYMVFAGLEPLVDALESLRVRAEDAEWLASEGVVDADTARRLGEMRFTCNIEAAPEGSLVFPGMPVLSIEGPYWQAQLAAELVASALEMPTAVATRFSRASRAASGVAVVEAGCGPRVGLASLAEVARAAYIGGAEATTNTLAARRYALPVRAVQPARFAAIFGSTTAAAAPWLAVAPERSVLRVDAGEGEALVDALLDALERRAQLRAWSTDDLWVEVIGEPRETMTEKLAAGFVARGRRAPVFVTSGALDEWQIAEHSIARIQPGGYLLDGLSAGAPGRGGGLAIRARAELVAIEDGGTWSPRGRRGGTLSESTVPGRKRVVRSFDADGRPVGDVAFATNERIAPARGLTLLERASGVRLRLADASTSAPLLTTVLRDGKRVAAPEAPLVARERAAKGVLMLPERFARLTSPARYPAGISEGLSALQADVLASVV